jgi:hypothetical protein
MGEFIKRDQFARTDLLRKRANVTGVTCTWCGRVKHRKNRKGEVTSSYLYQYYQETDNGRISLYRGLFCSTSCFRACSS